MIDNTSEPSTLRQMRKRARDELKARRVEAGLKIDPATALADGSYGQTLDPYGDLDNSELPEEFHCAGREHFACAPGSDVWVHFSDLPDVVRKQLWAKIAESSPFPRASKAFSRGNWRPLEGPRSLD